jgi:short-subunit dehydrogenase
MLAFTEAVSGEIDQSGVRLQVCLPGQVDTEYHALVGRDRSKMPPMMQAPDVVEASSSPWRMARSCVSQVSTTRRCLYALPTCDAQC